MLNSHPESSASEPLMYIIIKDNMLHVKFQHSYSIKRVLMTIAGVWALIQFLLPFLSSWLF